MSIYVCYCPISIFVQSRKPFEKSSHTNKYLRDKWGFDGRYPSSTWCQQVFWQTQFNISINQRRCNGGVEVQKWSTIRFEDIFEGPFQEKSIKTLSPNYFRRHRHQFCTVQHQVIVQWNSRIQFGCDHDHLWAKSYKIVEYLTLPDIKCVQNAWSQIWSTFGCFTRIPEEMISFHFISWAHFIILKRNRVFWRRIHGQKSSMRW